MCAYVYIYVYMYGDCIILYHMMLSLYNIIVYYIMPRGGRERPWPAAPALAAAAACGEALAPQIEC